MGKITAIALVVIVILRLLQYDDPGIPPGGDPDIDEVPLDSSFWFLLVAGGIYGFYHCDKYKTNERNRRI